MISAELQEKFYRGKRAKKANFHQKSTLIEQKVDLKPKTLDFRAFGIFADRLKKSQEWFPKP